MECGIECRPDAQVKKSAVVCKVRRGPTSGSGEGPWAETKAAVAKPLQLLGPCLIWTQMVDTAEVVAIRLSTTPHHDGDSHPKVRPSRINISETTPLNRILDYARYSHVVNRLTSRIASRYLCRGSSTDWENHDGDEDAASGPTCIGGRVGERPECLPYG